MRPSEIAIIGAGFSGCLLALHLSRCCQPGVRIRLIEQAAEFGPGVAYATACSEHLLNVPAGRMSAFPDQPTHFLEWLRRQPAEVLNGTIPEPGSFVSRRLYGGYVRALLADAMRVAPPGQLRLIRGTVIAAARDPAGLTLRLADGRAIATALAVLATGNQPPADPCPTPRGA